MKDQLLQLARSEKPVSRKNFAREYLQLYLLRLLHERGQQGSLAFVGGTALRLLHGLARFSEDLEFTAIEGQSLRAVDLFKSLKAACVAAGYGVGLKAKDTRTVASAMFRFEGLPKELGLSKDGRLALSVKLEIDMHPPAGAVCTRSLVQRFFPIALVHHDLPSLMAGKLHALLARPWPKGRDWYDLVWYLTAHKHLQPNQGMLENALVQTEDDPAWAERWPERLREKLAELDWAKIRKDLEPFLERPADMEQLEPDLIDGLLAAR